MLLPEPIEISIDRPHRISGEANRRPLGEGGAALLLWAMPELLRWSKPLAWLFSPVTGKNYWPGDLWGVDAEGDLLIVEAKTCVRDRGCNPFEDFVNANRKTALEKLATIGSGELRKHWRDYLKKEKTFIKNHVKGESLTDLSQSESYPGVVPYSRHRAQVQRWQERYIKDILPMVNGGYYEANVESYFNKREANPDPRPHIVGLGAEVEGGRFRPNKQGRADFRALRSQLRDDHVHLVALNITDSPCRAQVTSRRVALDAFK